LFDTNIYFHLYFDVHACTCVHLPVFARPHPPVVLLTPTCQQESTEIHHILIALTTEVIRVQIFRNLSTQEAVVKDSVLVTLRRTSYGPRESPGPRLTVRSMIVSVAPVRSRAPGGALRTLGGDYETNGCRGYRRCISGRMSGDL